MWLCFMPIIFEVSLSPLNFFSFLSRDVILKHMAQPPQHFIRWIDCDEHSG